VRNLDELLGRSAESWFLAHFLAFFRSDEMCLGQKYGRIRLDLQKAAQKSSLFSKSPSNLFSAARSVHLMRSQRAADPLVVRDSASLARRN
jgi:hypothetical protein